MPQPLALNFRMCPSHQVNCIRLSPFRHAVLTALARRQCGTEHEKMPPAFDLQIPISNPMTTWYPPLTPPTLSIDLIRLALVG
jgi:hypothetical protein